MYCGAQSGSRSKGDVYNNDSLNSAWWHAYDATTVAFAPSWPTAARNAKTLQGYF